MKLELSLAKCQLLIQISFRTHLRRRSSLTLLGFLLETGRRAVLLNIGRVQGEVAAATTIVVLSAIVVLAVVLTIVLAIVLTIVLAVILAIVLTLSTSTELSIGDTCHKQDREQC